MNRYLAGLITEAVNPETVRIDECRTEEMLALINRQDAQVPSAVAKEIPHIAIAVDILTGVLSEGGRMFYFGAGTSGRLGVLDASECPPTYGIDPELVQAYIAGGDTALRRAVEGCEDSAELGRAEIDRHGITAKDAVVGISASGSARYVLAAAEEAKSRGAKTIGVVTNPGTLLGKICDVTIAPVTGPEAVVGSTRMKSGTAQKLVLNMLTTCTMIKLGKVYGNLMVDLCATNAKLRDRANRIVRTVTGVSEKRAEELLAAAGMDTKLAIMAELSGLPVRQAASALERCGGRLKEALAQRE